MRFDDDEGRGPLCELCRDVGWIVVPHPMCVYHGEIVCRRGSRAVLTCAVACTNRVLAGGDFPRPCAAGAAAKASGSIDWDQYTTRIGGHDGVAMLGDYQEQQARDARARSQQGSTLPDLYAELLTRAAGVPA